MFECQRVCGVGGGEDTHPAGLSELCTDMWTYCVLNNNNSAG